MTRIGIDLDGVLADWSGGIANEIAASGHDASFLNWSTWDGAHTDKQRKLVKQAQASERFYRDLSPIPGAIQAVREIRAAGYDVFFVSTPDHTNPTCADDKIAWLETHFGEGFGKKLILTHDKTLINVDILIDDKPVITGVFPPTWSQIVFDQPYNQRTFGDFRYRLGAWSDWSTVLLNVVLRLDIAPASAKPRLIGMGGLLASGKDTVADHLVAQHGFVKLNMSSILHQAMLALDPWIPVNAHHAGDILKLEGQFVRYANLVERVGYTEAKKNPEVRTLLQKLGTDVGRNILGKEIWVDLIGDQVEKLLDAGTSVVISGIRYPNELGLIRRFSGELWWTERRTFDEIQESVVGHASENSVTAKDFDKTLFNRFTIADLEAEADYRLESTISGNISRKAAA